MEATEKKYSPDMSDEEFKAIPDKILKVIFDKDDNVLFGSRYIKGKVMYNYIPGELMTTGRDFIIRSIVKYDGVGNRDLSEDARIVDFYELKKLFPDNKFAN